MSMLRDFLAQLLNELLAEILIHRDISKRSANVYFHHVPPGRRNACSCKYIQNVGRSARDGAIHTAAKYFRPTDLALCSIFQGWQLFFEWIADLPPIIEIFH